MMCKESDRCRFVETICLLDGIPQHLDLHQARFEATQQEVWGRMQSVQLIDYLPDERPMGRAKWRIEYGEQIHSVQVESYTPRAVKTLRLIEDNTIDYHLKSADRSVLNAGFSLRGTADDVLFVRNGKLTDTSICNIALGDGKKWYTPRTPLLQGVQREVLLRQGVLQLADLTVSHLAELSRIALFNAMLPWGEVEFSTRNILL